jgi:hypothetical protein
MDQLAGPVPASLDQAVGSVLEDGRANWPSLMQTREPEAAPALAELTDTGSIPVYQSCAPPAPAWLLRQRTRGPSRRRAVLALAALTLAAIALAWTSVALALKGFASDLAGSHAAAGELLYPAPPNAGALPVHSRVIGNRGTQRAIEVFRHRFAAAIDSHASGGQAASFPTALYNEPGRPDPVTGTAAWVMYAGFNEQPGLSDPAATLNSLMAKLAGPGATLRPWQVDAGPAGGIAKCIVAIVGQTQVAVCGWATDRTIGAVMSPTRDTTVNELALRMSLMRSDLQPGPS